MKQGKWLAAIAGCLVAGAAAAADTRSEIQITPYVGYSRLRVNGNELRAGETARVDQLQRGVNLGVLTPFNVVIEAGTASAVHAELFGSEDDFTFDQDYAAIGYQADFGDGWRFVPKIGRMKWKLGSDGRELVDAFGERYRFQRGYDNFYEASLMRHVSKSIALGVNFRDIETDFGHSRSGTFVVTFGF